MALNKNNYNERGELISYELYDVFDDSSPFPHKKSRISPERFATEYRSFVGKYPFKPEYIGTVNPYTKKKVESKEDYYEYLREHCYYSLCDSFLASDRLKAFASAQEAQYKLNKAQARSDGLKRELEISEQDRSVLSDQKAKLQTALNDAKHSITRTRRYCFLFVVVVVLCSLLSASAIKNHSDNSISRSYEDGYAAGISDQQAEDANLYEYGKADGYQKGYAEGKDKGYNEGYYKGYWEGYADAGERSAGSGDSHGSNSGGSSGDGGPREIPVADTYIGNTKTKKFHLPSCSYLPDQNHQATFDSRDEAIAAGYTPCGHCKP